jgi:hypothetical protein
MIFEWVYKQKLRQVRRIAPQPLEVSDAVDCAGQACSFVMHASNEWSVTDAAAWREVYSNALPSAKLLLRNETDEEMVPLPRVGMRMKVLGQELAMTSLIFAGVLVRLPPGGCVEVDVEFDGHRAAS